MASSMDGGFFSAVRRHNRPECQATRRPYSSARHLVE
jgi:hypothetical protein